MLNPYRLEHVFDVVITYRPDYNPSADDLKFIKLGLDGCPGLGLGA